MIARWIIAAPLLVFAGIAQADDMSDEMSPEPAAPTRASAELKATAGSEVTGTVQFSEDEGGVRVVANVSGLSPGKHGFHVHEKGDCSAPDGTSAGGHFNPEGTDHGAPGADSHHAGDLGNLEADENGKAMLDTVFSGLTLSGDAGLVGRGLIVHADPDDLSSQPTGNAGARVACGVIEASP